MTASDGFGESVGVEARRWPQNVWNREITGTSLIGAHSQWRILTSVVPTDRSLSGKGSDSDLLLAHFAQLSLEEIFNSGE